MLQYAVTISRKVFSLLLDLPEFRAMLNVARLEQKLLCVIALKGHGMSQNKACRAMQISPGRFQELLKRYVDSGVEGLMPLPKSGRPPRNPKARLSKPTSKSKLVFEFRT